MTATDFQNLTSYFRIFLEPRQSLQRLKLVSDKLKSNIQSFYLQIEHYLESVQENLLKDKGFKVKHSEYLETS